MIAFTQFICEGGKATSTQVSRIKREHIKPTIDAALKKVSKLGVSSRTVRTIGSTGKKPDSGDIDLAILVGPVHKLLGGATESESIKKFAAALKNIFGESRLSFGNTVSVPVKIVGEEGYAQLDFMFTDDLDRASFAYHSPTPEESAYKGTQRNSLMRHIAKWAGRETGNERQYTRYWWDTSAGKLFVGRVENDKVVEKNPTPLKGSYIVKELLGNQFSEKDARSFESLWAAFKKSKKFNQTIRQHVIIDTKADIARLKEPVPKELG